MSIDPWIRATRTERRAVGRRRQPQEAIAQRRGKHRRQGRQRPDRPPPAIPGNHAGQARRAEHDQSADAIAADHVGDLNEGDPVVLGVAEAPHREAAEQVPLGQFEPGPDDRRGGDDRNAQAMHGDASQADEQRNIKRQIKREGDPAEARRPVRQPQPVQGAHPKHEAGQPQHAIRPPSRQAIQPHEQQPGDRSDPSQRPQIERRQSGPHQQAAREGEPQRLPCARLRRRGGPLRLRRAGRLENGGG